MSKAAKIIGLILLVILSTSAAAIARQTGNGPVGLFCSVMTIAFVVSIFVVLLSGRGVRRR